MASVYFTHPSNQVGALTIEDGIDLAEWAYNLNTVTFPTYGGEVVQILSVYIDDLTVGGSVSTYSQREAIYSYFAAFIQIATQGKNPHPAAGQSAYNLQPITFTYPERDWNFQIIPRTAPGFSYSFDTVVPQWQITAFVLDDSANASLNDIKDAIKAQTVANGLAAFQKINDEISPDSGNPETNPFQTYNQNAQTTSSALTSVADYYNTLLPYPSNGAPSGSTAAGPAPSTTTPQAGTPATGTPRGTSIP